uniref:Large ribosomal subunit protein bL9m n=1 Tax=Cairina moschata TaxID=8855 RepID=A0A8C3CPU9_CAIMO
AGGAALSPPPPISHSQGSGCPPRRKPRSREKSGPWGSTPAPPNPPPVPRGLPLFCPGPGGGVPGPRLPLGPVGGPVRLRFVVVAPAPLCGGRVGAIKFGSGPRCLLSLPPPPTLPPGPNRCHRGTAAPVRVPGGGGSRYRAAPGCAGPGPRDRPQPRALPRAAPAPVPVAPGCEGASEAELLPPGPGGTEGNRAGAGEAAGGGGGPRGRGPGGRHRAQALCGQPPGTVVVERWWPVPLSREGRAPRLHPRRHRVYRLLEDGKHLPKAELQLILTQAVQGLGTRGDTVLVKKSLGRNKLLPQGLAVYASPENRRLFEEERQTLQFLRSCRLEVGMKNNVRWELTPDIVARQFLRNLRVAVPPHALRLPPEPITRWGEYWCDVMVNGLDTVRVPMAVTEFLRPRTRRRREQRARQEALLAAKR